MLRENTKLFITSEQVYKSFIEELFEIRIKNKPTAELVRAVDEFHDYALRIGLIKEV